MCCTNHIIISRRLDNSMPQDKKDNAVQVKEPEAQPKSQESAEQSSESKKGENVKPETKQGETEKTEKGVEGATEETITLRPLTMEDLRLAEDQVSCW